MQASREVVAVPRFAASLQTPSWLDGPSVLSKAAVGPRKQMWLSHSHDLHTGEQVTLHTKLIYSAQGQGLQTHITSRRIQLTDSKSWASACANFKGAGQTPAGHESCCTTSLVALQCAGLYNDTVPCQRFNPMLSASSCKIGCKLQAVT